MCAIPGMEGVSHDRWRHRRTDRGRSFRRAGGLPRHSADQARSASSTRPRDAIREVSDNVTPLLAGERASTLKETNKQLARVDTITTNVADVTGNVSALVALFAATVGGPLIKLAGFSAGVRAALHGPRQAPAARRG